jgi:hypothetical protein
LFTCLEGNASSCERILDGECCVSIIIAWLPPYITRLLYLYPSGARGCLSLITTASISSSPSTALLRHPYTIRSLFCSTCYPTSRDPARSRPCLASEPLWLSVWVSGTILRLLSTAQYHTACKSSYISPRFSSPSSLSSPLPLPVHAEASS